MPERIRQPIHSHRRRSSVIGGRYVKSEGMPALQPIQDIYLGTPGIPERMYGAEKDILTIQRDFQNHREESIRHSERWATKESVADLDKETTRALTDLGHRLDKRVAWTILQTAGLIASLAYALILSYKHFIEATGP